VLSKPTHLRVNLDPQGLVEASSGVHWAEVWGVGYASSQKKMNFSLEMHVLGEF